MRGVCLLPCKGRLSHSPQPCRDQVEVEITLCTRLCFWGLNESGTRSCAPQGSLLRLHPGQCAQRGEGSL